MWKSVARAVRAGQTTRDPTDAIVRAPGALPILGHSLQLRRDALRFLESLSAYGDVVRIKLGTRDALVVCDPQLTVRMLRDDSVFDKGGGIIEAQKEVAGSNVVTYQHDEHRRYRRTLQPAFHGSRMPHYADLMNERIHSVVSSWRDAQVVDVRAEMYRSAVDVLFATMIGDTLPAETLRRFVENLEVKNTTLTTRVFMPPWLNKIPTPAIRRYRRSISDISRMTNDILADGRERGFREETLASIIVKAANSCGKSDESGGQLAESVRANLMAFVLAGSDTTANVMAWALHLLAHHPDTQDRMRGEIEEVLNGDHATPADLPRLAFTGNVLNETLRLYPPAFISNRTTATDTQLGPYLCPADTTIFWSSYLIHRRPDLYDEPERFNPGRWDGKANRPGADDFIPFSVGARKCIGDVYARVEATLTLAAVIARWRVEPVAGPAVRPRTGSMLTPSHVRLRVFARGDAGPALA